MMSPLILDYEIKTSRPSPSRVWIPLFFFFFSLVTIGEILIVRIYRGPWPVDEDYFLFAILLFGALMTALGSKVSGFVIGLYGLIGLATFMPGSQQSRDFKFRVAEPGAVPHWTVGWTIALLVIWTLFRPLVLLRSFVGTALASRAERLHTTKNAFAEQ